MAITGSSSSAATSDAPARAADVVVGLATYNHARTAGAVVGHVRQSLEALPSVRWCIVAADGGSTDGTLERMREAAGGTDAFVEVPYTIHPADALDVPYHGLPGRGRALRAILQEARTRQARACLVLDARADPPSANWPAAVDSLSAGELDYVSPVYCRHPATAGLVHGVVSPLFRALYGLRLSTPLALEFGCSGRFLEAALAETVWDSEREQRTIDLWLSTMAAAGGFQVGEAHVGGRHGSERPDVNLATTVSQVVGALFSEMESRVQVWQRIRGSRPVRQLGERQTCEEPALDAGSLIESFKLGYAALQDVWGEVLPPMAILQWRRLATQPMDGFRVDEALWARTIYDFAMGHRLRVIARDHLLRSLTPLYLAWLASFIQQTRHTGVEEAEARVEQLALAFEAEKPYIISQWRWPERFRPVKLRR